MAMRRRVRLWQHDSDIPPEKQGSRLFRALTGKAAVLAETLDDDDLFHANGVQKIQDFFDQCYRGFMALRGE
eukprot:905488-Alexandrium_andersonii.AAC.1